MITNEVAFVAIAVADKERARKFYQETLELKPATTAMDGAWIEYELGAVTLGVGCHPDWKPSQPGTGTSVALEVDDFDAAYEKLKQRGVRSRLVGFTLIKGDKPPEEGCQVVDQGLPVGRVTSARFSPTLGHCIGLAWLPAARSAVGERFTIRASGANLPALITQLPFYDPEGQRLKG